MKTIVTIFISISFLLIIGCGKQDVKAPEVDLHAAVVTGNIEAILQHVKAGSDLNVKEHTRGSTPLITAALFGKTDEAIALIEGGADLNYQNNEGSTALHTAVFACRLEIVNALLENGADKNLKNAAGRIPRESVTVPFEDIKFAYDQLGAGLAPLGLILDYDYIQATRPIIADLLK
ncbi:MAG: ankyrin repeat domain-containing protein [FCB group bacterium]|nr:ankyrin repeat domain-containing protein [FCB group bacterium]